jgi:dihydroorotate dehydrogenase
MTEEALRDVIAVISSTGIDGVIATNTTISRDDLTTPEVDALGPGGISGVPVRDRSTEVIRFLHRESGGSFPIIGVGGIDGPEAAREKIDAGAVLVQVYSGLVFEGPGLVRRINRGLR